MGFPGCYGSQSDVFAASSGFVHIYYGIRKREKSCLWWQKELYTRREVYSGSKFPGRLEFSVGQWVI
jgi:hypothetical protein